MREGEGWEGFRAKREGRAESCVRLSEGGLRRVKGEFGAAEDGLLARGRRQRRLIHPGRSHGGCHCRSGGDHWPERVQRGDGLGLHRGDSLNCLDRLHGLHSRHARDGGHCAR